MAITSGDIGLVNEMLGTLGIEPSDDVKDFPADVLKMLKEFDDITTKVFSERRKYQYDGAYEDADGGNIVVDAKRLKRRLEIAVVTGQGEMLKNAFEGRSFPEAYTDPISQAKYLMGQLDKFPEIVEVLDQLEADGWQIDEVTPVQQVEEKPSVQEDEQITLDQINSLVMRAKMFEGLLQIENLPEIDEVTDLNSEEQLGRYKKQAVQYLEGFAALENDGGQLTGAINANVPRGGGRAGANIRRTASSYIEEIKDIVQNVNMLAGYEGLQLGSIESMLGKARVIAAHAGVAALLPEVSALPEDSEFAEQASAYLSEFMALEEKGEITKALDSTIVGPHARVRERQYKKAEDYKADVKEIVAQITDIQSTQTLSQAAQEEHEIVTDKEALEGGVGGSKEEDVDEDSGEEYQNDDTSLEVSSIYVETVLRDVIAPLMKANKAEIKVNQSPDGMFDEVSQKALQQFLIAADAKFGDIGDDPWLYTAEKGQKLAENMKNYLQENPAYLIEMGNKALRDSYIKDNKPDPGDFFTLKEDGTLVYANDSLGDKGEIVSDADKEMLRGAADKKINDFITHLNILAESKDEKNKLSTVQLGFLSDFMAPEMQFFGFLFAMMSKVLPPSWMNAISDFCGQVLGVDLEMLIPKDDNGNSLFGKAMGVTDDKESNSKRLSELYKNALDSGKTPQELRQLVRDGMKKIYGGSTNYDDVIDDACKQAEEVATRAKGLDKNSEAYAKEIDTAARTFSAAFMEGRQKLKDPQVKVSNDAGNVPNQAGNNAAQPGQNEPLKDPVNFSEYTKRFLSISADHKRASKKVSRNVGNLNQSPVIAQNRHGRTFVYYIDVDSYNRILSKEQDIREYIGKIKDYDEKVSAAERDIAIRRQKLTDTYGEGSGLEGDEKRVYENEKVKIRQLEAIYDEKYPASDRAGIAERLEQYLADYKGMVGSQYQHVDVTREIDKARKMSPEELDVFRYNRVSAKSNFPGMYKIAAQSNMTLYLEDTSNRRRTSYKKAYLYSDWRNVSSVAGHLNNYFEKGRYNYIEPSDSGTTIAVNDYRQYARSSTRTTQPQPGVGNNTAVDVQKQFQKASEFINQWNPLEQDRGQLNDQYVSLQGRFTDLLGAFEEGSEAQGKIEEYGGRFRELKDAWEKSDNDQVAKDGIAQERTKLVQDMKDYMAQGTMAGTDFEPLVSEIENWIKGWSENEQQEDQLRGQYTEEVSGKNPYVVEVKRDDFKKAQEEFAKDPTKIFEPNTLEDFELKDKGTTPQQ